jgi:hypothetical protein
VITGLAVVLDLVWKRVRPAPETPAQLTSSA